VSAIVSRGENMIKSIFRSIFITSLAAVILVSAFIILYLFRTFEASAMDDLKMEADYILQKLVQEQNETAYLTGFYSNNRITLVAEDGSVLYDNTTNASSMGNHADRPEIISAMDNGIGESRRYSDTLSVMIIYYAVRTESGSVLRVSKTQGSALGLIWKMLPAFMIIVAVVALLSLSIARYMSRKIIAPINTLNLDDPLENDTYDELSPLMLRIDRQHKEINNKILEITEKQREFTAVTENMREGLVLLSRTSDILSINKSAIHIFGAKDDTFTGHPILSLNRSSELQSIVESTIKGAKSEAQLKIENKYYQIIGSPAASEDGTLGSVILILDITDQQSAERSRREFTANVSHELKTPLTSISGFAEIMKNGMAKPEDMKDFAGRIYCEANRMIALINDILRLSQLDEKTKMQDKEPVDLFELAEAVGHLLQPFADEKEVKLIIRGEHVIIPGNKNILNEMMYNLCDNAIKYNVSQGSLTVDITRTDGHAIIAVNDTGIGISDEQQPHVFERFYRVDKSRSKATGGTGLGLSIVKHGAQLHGAKIELTSKENSGTSVVLTFPEINE
jgi:two-component system, OmpR family, phosphate regulon sensor histidine kinase PhoR